MRVRNVFRDFSQHFCRRLDAPAAQRFNVDIAGKAHHGNLVNDLGQGHGSEKVGNVDAAGGKLLCVRRFADGPSVCVHRRLKMNKVITGGTKRDHIQLAFVAPVGAAANLNIAPDEVASELIPLAYQLLEVVRRCAIKKPSALACTGSNLSLSKQILTADPSTLEVQNTTGFFTGPAMAAGNVKLISVN